MTSRSAASEGVQLPLPRAKVDSEGKAFGYAGQHTALAHEQHEGEGALIEFEVGSCRRSRPRLHSREHVRTFDVKRVGVEPYTGPIGSTPRRGGGPRLRA